MNDFDAAIARVETSAEALMTAFVDVTEILEGELSALSDQVESTLATTQAISDSGGQALEDLAGESEALLDGFRALVLSPETISQTASVTGEALDGLRIALRDLQDGVSAGLEDISGVFVEGMAVLEERVEMLGELLNETVKDNIDTLSSRIGDKLSELLSDQQAELYDGIEEQLHEVISELTASAEGVEQMSREAVEDLRDKLADTIRDRSQKLLADEVGELGETVIATTLQEIYTDISMTQISAQLTTVISGQLPQLIVAKNAVGAVKRGLDLLRSGGV